jgi:tape measure domain-containing protein
VAASEDIILRILGETAPFRSDLASTQFAFEKSLEAMRRAAEAPAFDPLSEGAIELRLKVQQTGEAFVAAFERASSSSATLRAALKLSEQSIDDIKAALSSLNETDRYLASLSDDATKASEGFRIVREAIGDLATANDAQLSKIRDATRRALDAYEALGSQAPADIQEVARSLGVLSSAQQRTSASTRSLETDLTNSARKSVAAFDSLIGVVGDFATANESQLTKVRASTKQVLDSYELLGARVPSRVAEVAKSLGVLSTQQEKTAQSQKALANELETTAERSLTSFRTLTKTVGDFATANSTQLEKVRDSTKRVLDAYDVIGREVPVDVKQAADSLGILSTQQQRVAASQKTLSDELQAGAKKALANFTSLKAVVGDFANANQTQLTRVGQSARQVIEAYDLIGKEVPLDVKQAAASLDAFEVSQKKVRSGVDNLQRAFRSLRNVLASLGLALGARELFQFGKEAVQVTVRMEAMRAQINAAAGSVEAGADLFKFATDQANRLGQSYFTVGEATARFEAASRQSNLTLDERRFVIEKVLEASRTLQLSDQRIGNTLLALEQIVSKGTFSLEELRRQLGDNIPGAVQILARELDVTVAQLFKMIEANEVSAESVVNLAEGFDKAFGPGLQGALETTATKLGQVKNRIVDIQVEFGNAFSGALAESISKFNSEVSTLESGSRRAGEGAAALTRSILWIIDTVGKAGEGLGLLKLVLDQDVEGVKSLTENMDEAGKSALEMARLLPLVVDSSTDAGEAVKILYESLSELQRTGNTNASTLGALAQAARAVAEKIGETSPALERFIEVIAELSGESETSSEKISRLTGTLDRLIASGHSSSGSFQVLAHELDAFVASGANSRVVAGELTARVDEMIASHERAGEQIPPTLTKIREALQEVVDAYQSGAQQVEAALEDIAASQAEFYGGLKRDAKEAADEAIKLAVTIEDSTISIESSIVRWDQAIGSFVRSGGDLARANETQLEALKKKIQEALDAYLLLGEEVPPALQDLADELGVLSSVAEKELEKQIKAAEKAAKEEKKAIEERLKNYAKLVEAIRDVTRELQPESRTDEVSDEIKKLQTELNSLESKAIFDSGDPERIQELKDQIFDLRGELTDLEQGFEQTSATVEDVDDAIRDLLEGNSEAFAQLTSSQRASIANLLSGLQSLASTGNATGGAVVDIFKQVAGVLDESGVNTEALYEAFGDLDGQGLNVAETLDRLIRAVDESEKGQGTLAEQAKETTHELEEQKEAVTKLVEEIKKVAVEGVKAMTPFRDIMSETLDICLALKECMEELGR